MSARKPVDLAKFKTDILRATIKAAERGASAKELAEYFEEAARGMRVNAAFRLEGKGLSACLQLENL